jgi:hypothetical protein
MIAATAVVAGASALACIVHKSRAICEQCRLSPASALDEVEGQLQTVRLVERFATV